GARRRVAMRVEVFTAGASLATGAASEAFTAVEVLAASTAAEASDSKMAAALVAFAMDQDSLALPATVFPVFIVLSTVVSRVATTMACPLTLASRRIGVSTPIGAPIPISTAMALGGRLLTTLITTPIILPTITVAGTMDVVEIATLAGVIAVFPIIGTRIGARKAPPVHPSRNTRARQRRPLAHKDRPTPR